MWYFRIIGIIAGVFSLISLGHQGLNLQLGPALMAVLQVYEASIAQAIQFLEPLINDQLRWLRVYFDWNLHLHAHWKHFFVLMLLYFGAFARQAAALNWYGTAIFETISGFMIALVFGVACGTFPISAHDSGVWIALVPIAGIFLFVVGDSLWAALTMREKPLWVMLSEDFVLLMFMIIPVLFFSTQSRLSVFGPLPSPGLAILAMVVLSISLRHLWRGSMSQPSTPGSEWQAFLANPNTHVGMDMLATIGGAVSVTLIGSS